MTRLSFRKITLSLAPAVPSLPAPKAQHHCQPGATLQDLCNKMASALKARLILTLNGDFSALLPRVSNSWGGAPGSSDQGTVGAKQIVCPSETSALKASRNGNKGAVTSWQQ
jgi:hypothetical protein